MAVIVKNTAEKQTKIKGTDLTIDNVYVRLVYVAKADGTSVEVELLPYENVTKYTEDLQIRGIDLPKIINGQVVSQTIDDVHILVKNKLEELGYQIDIVINNGN